MNCKWALAAFIVCFIGSTCIARTGVYAQDCHDYCDASLTHEFLCRLELSSTAVHIEVSDTVAYVAMRGGLCSVSISDPDNPYVCDYIPISNERIGLSLLNGLALIGVAIREEMTVELLVVDATKPDSLEVIGSCVLTRFDDYPSSMEYALSLKAFEHYVYFAYMGIGEFEWHGDECIVDVSDPAEPVVTGRKLQCSAVTAVDVKGNCAFVLIGNSMYTRDITPRTAPQDWGRITLPGRGYGVTAVGRYAYVCCGENVGVVVVNVFEPVAPALVTRLETNGSAGFIVFDRDYAYLSSGPAGLQIIDVSDLRNPILCGGMSSCGSRSVALSNNRAIIADGDCGLRFAPLQCEEISPTFLRNFDLAAGDECVAITWTVQAANENCDFRLKGEAEECVWNVDYMEVAPSVFVANDASDHVARASVIKYNLSFRELNGEWREAASRTIRLDIADVGTGIVGAHPNPFNPLTHVSFKVNQPQPIRIVLFDMSGHRVATLADKVFDKGHHSLTWPGTDSQGRAVASGTYIVRLEAEGVVDSRKIVLVR